MPGLITHYICGNVTLQKLSKGQQIITANRQIYNVGTQGPDIFFYCLPLLMRKGLHNVGSLMHNQSVGLFVDTMLTYIEPLPKRERDGALSYLAGYLTHYCLDCKTHPYIYYKSGFRKKGDKIKAIRHSVHHRNFETAIDVLMLRLISSERPSDQKLWQWIHIKKAEALPVATIISGALKNAYKLPISNKQVYQAISYTTNVTRLMQSKTGKRKRIFEFIEDAAFGERLFSALIHLQDIEDDIDYLNSKKANWCMPWDNAQVSQLSFAEMFTEAVASACTMVEALFDYADGNMTKDHLLHVIGNYSFATGMDAEMKLKFKYSDVVYAKQKRQRG